MMKNDIELLFKKLKGSFDEKEPLEGHEQRFLIKLKEQNNDNQLVTLNKKPNAWVKPLAIAASLLFLFSLSITTLNKANTIDEQVADMAPEISQAQFYFTSLIEEQVKQLKNENTPQTKKIIDDTIFQLKKLDNDYKLLEKDLLNGGNSKLIIRAMVTNFQTRIDLLQEVLQQISTIKKIKTYDDANFTL